jgi:Glyoxalase-like domain
MRTVAILIAAFLAGCASTPPAPHVDHVMLGISDLDRGIRELESLTGGRAVYGGEHPGRGTHNALVSLGSERQPSGDVLHRETFELAQPLDNAPRLGPAAMRVALQCGTLRRSKPLGSKKGRTRREAEQRAQRLVAA